MTSEKGMPSKKMKVVLAAGGTGGHLFPAQALAEELISRKHIPVLIYDQRVASLVKDGLSHINKLQIFAPPAQRSVWARIKQLFSILTKIKEIRQALQEQKADIVIGFGGYPSLPAMLAALTLRIPCYFHEQNAVLGRVNRFLLPFVRKAFLSFPQTRNLPPRYHNKTMVVGSLVRKQVRRQLQAPLPPGDKITIVVLGGSQGARIMSDIVPHSIKNLPLVLRKKLQVFQQVREEFLAEVQLLYRNAKVLAHVQPFFENVGEIISMSDLVIGRSGASTVAEIALAGKPSILVPLKIATDDHQFYNARYLSDLGASVIMRESSFNVVNLTGVLQELLQSSRLKNMAEACAIGACTQDGAPQIMMELEGLRKLDGVMKEKGES